MMAQYHNLMTTQPEIERIIGNVLNVPRPYNEDRVSAIVLVCIDVEMDAQYAHLRTADTTAFARVVEAVYFYGKTHGH